MALPFLAGLALGGLAIYAFNNKEKIKDELVKGAKKGKKFALEAKDKIEEKFDKPKKAVRRRTKATNTVQNESQNEPAKKKRKPRTKKVATPAQSPVNE